MKTCVDCEKKATFQCTQCKILMCKDHRIDHQDAYEGHISKKHKKIIPGVKSRIDPWTSKINGLTQAYGEIMDSDSVLNDKVEKARNEAIRKIEQERKQLLKFIGTLSNELTDEQAKAAEERIKELRASLLLYQGQALQNTKNIFAWHQAEILEEKAYAKFHNTQDTEEFQVIHCMALIKSQEIDFLSSDADCLRSQSMFSQREERERILRPAKEIYERYLQTKSEILELDLRVKKDIMKASENLINAAEILKNEQYIPPPGSLVSELSIIYKTIQECLDIRPEILLNFINEPRAESIIEGISNSNQINDQLQSKIEFCNELLALIKDAVFEYWEDYQDMKVSSDRKYYFVCE